MDNTAFDELEKTLSKERLSYWIDLANGDRERGLLLHRRNALMAAVFFADLQVLEVALRNAFDRELQQRYPPDWLDHSLFKDRAAVEQAKRFAREIHGAAATKHDKILVCLGFGFWVGLSKWVKFRPLMEKAFRDDTDLDKTSMSLVELLTLRNAMAHHEPILDGTRTGRTLEADLTILHNILSSISPATANWLDEHSWIRPLALHGLASCAELKSHELSIHVP
jgi:hypothetical protein